MSGAQLPNTVAAAISVSSGLTSRAAVASLITNLKTAVSRGADGVPEAAAQIAQLNPDLATKSLLASKTAYGSIAVVILTIIVQKFQLGWSVDAINLVAGAGVMIWLRCMTKAPIGSLIPQTTPSPSRGTTL